MSNWDQKKAVAVLLALALAGAVAGSLLMFSTFMVYDDEGYVLISLRNFVIHGHLYNDVYSQYGPFPFAFYALLHGLGFPFSSVSGRLITLVTWSACAVLPSLAILRRTRSLPLAAASLAGTDVFLWTMTHEPTHPGGLVAAISALLAWAGTRWTQAGNQGRLAFAVGAAVAAMILTKINVGGMAALSIVILTLLYAESPRVRRVAPWVACLLIALIPPLLMKSLASAPWVQKYAAVFVSGGITAVGATSLRTFGLVSMRRALYTLCGGLAAAAVVIVYVLYKGTTPAGLLEGILLGPLRHPSRFSLQFPWPSNTLIWSLASVLLFVAAVRLRKTVYRPTTDVFIASLRLLLGSGFATLLWSFPQISPDEWAFGRIMPALWIFLWPLATESDQLVAFRNWVGLLLLGQFLHAFPVPGSQVAWGTFLALPVAALGVAGATGYLRALLPDQVASRWRVATRGLAAVALGVFSSHEIFALYQTGWEKNTGRSVGLSGSGPLRLPDITAAVYRIIAFNALTHADMLFSLPGMFSLNLWTQLPTPTLANATHWFSLLDDTQQREIVAALAAHPTAVVVSQLDHLKFLRERGLSPGGIAYDYIEKNYSAAFTIDNFQFLVRNGTQIAPFFTGELFSRKESGDTSGITFNTLLKFPVLLAAGEKIARIDILRADRNQLDPILLGPENSRVALVPINLRGSPIGPEESVTFPLDVAHPAELQIYFNRAGRLFPPSQTLVVLRGAHNEELALALLRQ